MSQRKRTHLVYINGVNACKNGIPKNIHLAFGDCFAHHVVNPTLSFVQDLAEFTESLTHAAVGTGSVLGLLAFLRAGGAVDDGTSSWSKRLYYTVGSALETAAESVAQDLCRTLSRILNSDSSSSSSSSGSGSNIKNDENPCSIIIVAHSHGGWALLWYLKHHTLPKQVVEMIVIGSPVTVRHRLARNIWFDNDPICGLFDQFIDDASVVFANNALLTAPLCCGVEPYRRRLCDVGVYSNVLRTAQPNHSNEETLTVAHYANNYGLFLLQTRRNAVAEIVCIVSQLLWRALATAAR